LSSDLDPNGLAAAITLARARRPVVVFEARDRVGGGTRSAELTLSGFLHDVCSAIHPLGAGSPFFCQLPLAAHGLEWIHPPAGLAHPFDDGTSVLLECSIDTTAKMLGSDAAAYQKLMGPLVANWEKLTPALLGPLRFPRHPVALAHFGLSAIRSAHSLAKSWFQSERARGFFAGLAAHSTMPLEQPPQLPLHWSWVFWGILPAGHCLGVGRSKWPTLWHPIFFLLGAGLSRAYQLILLMNCHMPVPFSAM